jgi:O-antigen/teichoic acid export membrane protein
VYGSWLAGFALISMVGLLEFGLGPFLVRETATLRIKEASSQEWSTLFSTVLSAYLIVAIGVFLLGWVAAPWVADLVTAEKGAPDQLVSALRWAAVQIAVAQPLGIWRSLVHGSQKLGTLGYLSVVESVTLAVSTTAFLMLWPSVLVLPLASLLSVAVLAAVAYVCTPAEIRQAIWPLKSPTREIIHDMVKYCHPWMGAKVCFHIRERTDEPVVAYFLGEQAVVVYTVTQRLVRSIPLTLLGSVTSLGFAPLSEVLAAGGKARVRSVVLEMFPWLVLFAAGTASLIWAVNPIFVGLWVGASHYGGDLLSLVFCTWILLEVFSRGLGVVLYAAGEQTTMVRAQASEAILNLGFSLLLVGPLGLVGVALGTALASLASTAWAIPLAVIRLLGITRIHLFEALQGGFLLRIALLVGGIIVGKIAVTGRHWTMQLAVPCSAGIVLAIMLFWREWHVKTEALRAE